MWLHHQYLLLEHDEATGQRLVEDAILANNALAGALLAELQMQERLVAASADRFALRPGLPPIEGTLALAESRLAGRKPLPLSRCLDHVNGFAHRIRTEALAELVKLGALREQADKLWFITWRRRWPEDDPDIERTVRERLDWWARHVQPDDPPSREDLLLSLMRVTKLLPWDLADPKPGSLEERVLERTVRAPIGKTVKRATETQHAAMMAAAVASI